MEIDLFDQELDKFDETYVLQTVTMDTILEELHQSKDDTAITKSIILSLEEDIAKGIKDYLVVSLPLVGNVQKDATRTLMKDRWQELQDARKRMTKEEYIQYSKLVRKEIKDELANNYRQRKIIEKFRRKHKKLYDKYVKTRGFGYANLYVKSIIWLHDVIYDEAVQEAYDRLNGVI